MPEYLKLSQIGSSPLPPPFRGLHSPGVRKHCQIVFACYFQKLSIGLADYFLLHCSSSENDGLYDVLIKSIANSWNLSIFLDFKVQAKPHVAIKFLLIGYDSIKVVLYIQDWLSCGFLSLKPTFFVLFFKTPETCERFGKSNLFAMKQLQNILQWSATVRFTHTCNVFSSSTFRIFYAGCTPIF